MKLAGRIVVGCLIALASVAAADSLPGVPYDFLPSTGEVRLLVLLVNFPEQSATFGPDDFKSLFFSVGSYPTGSLADYYAENSYGQLRLTGEVRGWYAASQPQAYYARGEYGQQPAAHPQWLGGLVEEAVRQADAEVDFSRFDNSGDGQVDGLVVIHQGAGSDFTSRSEHLWSTVDYVSRGSGAALTLDGVKVDRFLVLEELAPPDKILPLGVAAHELGHLLGLPDYYQYSGKLALIGYYDLMSAGTWGAGNADRPFQLSVFSKARLGWVEPERVTDAKTVELPPIETEPRAVRLDTPRAGEYFLLEHRSQTGFDQNLPAAGLLIWHVDENVATGNSRSCTGCCPGHPLLTLEQADGQNDLEKGKNRGEAADFFPGPEGKATVFGHETRNGANLHQGADSLNWACEPTGVRVEDIRLADGKLTFKARTDDRTPVYPTSPLITVRGVQFEELAGNGNGAAEPGEKISLHPVLANAGGRSKGLAVRAMAVPLTFEVPRLKLPSLAPLEILTTPDGFPFTVPADFATAKKVEVHFTVVAKKSGYIAELKTPVIIGRPEVLVVNDRAEAAAQVFGEVLDRLGEPYARLDRGAGALPAAKLGEHGIVIWLAGWRKPPEMFLDAEAQAALAGYLDGGGNLLLAAPGLRLDGAEEFAARYLHVSPGTAFSGFHLLAGATADIISRGPGPASQPKFGYPSLPIYAELVPAADAAAIYRDRYARPLAVRFPASRPEGFKAVTLAFSAEALRDNDRQQLLQRSLLFFRRPVDAPLIEGLSPHHGLRGMQGFTIVLEGINLQPELEIGLGPGITVRERTRLPNGNLQLTVDIAPTTGIGPRDLSIATPGGEAAVYPGVFTVIP